MKLKSLVILTSAVAIAGCQTMAGTVDQAQRMLNQLGYNAGPVDGAYGGKTRGALEAFYADLGKTFDGKLDRNEVNDLRSEVSNRGISSYVPQSSMAVQEENFSNIQTALRNQLLTGSHTFKGKYRETYQYVGSWQRADMNNDGYDDVVLTPVFRAPKGTTVEDWRPDIGYCADHSVDRSNDPKCKAPFHTPVIAWGDSRGGFTLDNTPFVSNKKKGNSVGNMGIADFNGDGYPDIWMFSTGANNHKGEDILWLSNSNGTKWVDSRDNVRGLREDFTHGGTVGDIDGDGDIDVVATSNHGTGGMGVVCYVNDGSGNFKTSNCGDRRTPVAWAVTLADFDGDGDLDAMMGSDRNYGRTNWAGHEVWLNNGKGNFNKRMAKLDLVDPCITTTPYMYSADVDGDGDMDGIISAVRFNYALSYIIIQENIGGKFKPHLYEITSINDYPSHVQGRFKITNSTRTENCKIEKYGKPINEGTELNAHIRNLWVVDFDGDGDKDIWFSRGPTFSNIDDALKRKVDGGWLMNTGNGLGNLVHKNSQTKWRMPN